jgi:ABC-type thiamin/hydroxymethylpyrimidine transport system permease subunit
LRLRREHPQADFSVSKLMAGIVQVIAVAILFMAFLNRADHPSLMALLTFALTLQTMTIALLIMGKQK